MVILQDKLVVHRLDIHTLVRNGVRHVHGGIVGIDRLIDDFLFCSSHQSLRHSLHIDSSRPAGDTIHAERGLFLRLSTFLMKRKKQDNHSMQIQAYGRHCWTAVVKSGLCRPVQCTRVSTSSQQYPDDEHQSEHDDTPHHSPRTRSN